MDYSLPVSSVHVIFQARILEWVAISSSKGSSQPQDWTHISCIDKLILWAVVLEKTLESPLDCKEIQPVHPKGDHSWIFIGSIDAEAETPILWTPDAKSWLIWKDFDAGKDWRWEEKGMTEDEMVGWCHRLNGHEFESTLGVGDGQGGLACCSPWGHKESDMTEWLNWTKSHGKPEGQNYLSVKKMWAPTGSTVAWIHAEVQVGGGRREEFEAGPGECIFL